MQIKVKDIYRIKCAIGRTLFLGRDNWNDLVTIESDDYGGEEGAYLRFKMSQSSVSFSSNGMVHIHSIGGRKSIKFTHFDINDSIDLIVAKLTAISAGVPSKKLGIEI
ncbi:hypothetical protein [Chamaesiphon sp.]|uniref:hypothetical protein n=1 Tax=Chamaesiphon sp. TaxID=2814140 RepID=UPI0035934A03